MSDMPKEIHAYEYERLKLRFWRLDPTDLGETRYVRADIATRMLVMLKETQFSLKETLDNPSRAGKYDQWLHDEISQVIAEAGGENEK